MKMKQALTILGFILFLSSCQKNTGYSTEGLAVSRPNETRPLVLGSLEAEAEIKANWQLTSVYSNDNEETAFIKVINNQPVVFPVIWRKFASFDRDPTDGETGFNLPLNYQAVWLNNISVPNPTYPIVLAKVIMPDGYTTATLYQLENDKVTILWTLTSLGDVTTSYNAQGIPLFYNIEYTSSSQITTTYFYNPSNQTVEMEGQFSKAMNRNPEITALLSLPIVEQEKLLQGAWIKADNAKEGSASYLFFNRGQRELLFGQQDMLEVFYWPSSTWVYNGLYLLAINSQIDYIRHNLRLAYDNSRQIVLNFSGDSIWSGTYRRMSSQEKISSLQNVSAITKKENPLMGQYMAVSGDEYTFNYPMVTLKRKDSTLTGLYSHYFLNNQEILQLHFTNNLGFITDRTTYLADIEEDQEAGRTKRIVHLISGKLLVWGFEADDVKDFYLESMVAISGS